METTPLPSYARPPVAEVVLTIQFVEPLPVDFFALAELADAFSDRYPIKEAQPSLSPMALEATPVALRLDVGQVADLPRLWFLDEDGSRLVQLQSDRLSVNWRRSSDPEDEYPRYDSFVRPMAEDAWNRLVRGLAEHNIDPPQIQLCEVLYINPIEADGLVWTEHSELANVIAPWSGSYSDDFLPAPSHVSMTIRYELPNSDGWMLAELHPTQRADNGTPTYLLQLTARGSCEGSYQSALLFFDTAREWIVRGFTSLTTKDMHAHWLLKPTN